MRFRRSRFVVLIVLVLGAGPQSIGTSIAADPASEGTFAPECGSPNAPFELTVGAVACQRIASGAVGGEIPFSYYVPPGCAASNPAAIGGVRPPTDPSSRAGFPKKCPVLLIMHGTGCNYSCVLGEVGETDPYRLEWVRPLTSGPPEDPHSIPDPWKYNNPDTWVPRPPIDMVLIAPHNMTVPGGYGPRPFVDGGWADWNPRYAQGGDAAVYDTPPPRFETHVIHELIPYVESHFPVGSGREYRAITGFSQGGLGAAKLGLQHPDVFATFNQQSGASIPLGYVPGAAAARQAVPGVAMPAELPYVQAPGAVPAVYAQGDPPVDPTGFHNALRAWFIGLGDPVADEAWWRGNTSQDLAANARAWSGTVQSLPIDMFSGDAIDHTVGPDNVDRLTQCVGCGVPVDYLEVFANYIVAVQRVAFDSEEVEYFYEMRPGGHGHPREFNRFYLERIYSRVRHADGTGSPPPAPDRFDYRTINPEIDVWGWEVQVEREPVEFLNLRDVSCSSITLQGSGVATVTVPAHCGTGVAGSSTFTVALGPSAPTDEHAMASYTGTYNAATTLELTPV